MSVTHHHRTKLGILLSLVLAGGLLLLLAVAVVPGRAMPTAATVINVTTTADAVINNGNCSLREAIEAANNNVVVDACPAGSPAWLGTDLIKVPEGVYLITIPGKNENNNDTGDLDILEDVIIRGAGPEFTTIDGNQLDRVFHILNAEVEIAWLTIQNGALLQSPVGEKGGAGILNETGTLTLRKCYILSNDTDKFGGGLANLATAKAYDSTFRNNTGSQGGAIYSDGGLDLETTTVFSNTATVTGGGLDSAGEATLTNVTLTTNNAPSGGGIFNDGNQLYILNSTIAWNSNGVHHRGGEVRFKNTMVVYSTSENCSGTASFKTEGNNLDSDDTCRLKIDAGDLISTDPLLEILADNKGPTWTHALQAGSPAIDHGDDGACPIFDQRGAIRPADGDESGSEICDIGAYEYGAEFPKPVFLPLVIR